MTTTPRIWRIALWASPVLLVAGGFLATAAWLRTVIGATAVTFVAAAAAVFVMGYAIYVSARVQRGMDEVQKAGAGFAARWGPSVGHIAFVLLLLLPPVQTAMTTIVTEVAADPGTTVQQDVVRFSMVLGFIGVVVLQLVGTMIVSAGWWMAKR